MVKHVNVDIQFAQWKVACRGGLVDSDEKAKRKQQPRSGIADAKRPGMETNWVEIRFTPWFTCFV